MSTKTMAIWLSVISVVVMVVVGLGVSVNRGVDATEHITESPKVEFTGNGEVTARFADDAAPRLTKWWNGQVVASCLPGYHFAVRPSPGSENEHEDATCEPNPSK